MRRCAFALLSFLIASPLLAQRRVDLLFDVEGERRTGTSEDFTPNTTQYNLRFGTAGGIGGGVNWFFSDRVSLEAKVAGLASRLHVRTIGSDFVFNADLGWAQIYPIMAVLQWHPLEKGSFRPYLGIGGAHVILRNIERNAGPITGVRFKDPTGVVLDAGLQLKMSKRWSAYGDIRYVPIETSARATLIGTRSAVDLHVRPLIGAFGLAYHY